MLTFSGNEGRPRTRYDYMTTDKFFNKIGKSLGEEADIRASRMDIPIVCKDTDEITTKEGVRNAMEKQFDLIGLQEPAAKTTKKVYGRTQTVIISLPVEAALKLLSAKEQY